MMQSRTFIIITFSAISLLTCLFTLHLLLLEGSSREIWAGLIAGSSLGVWCCIYFNNIINKSIANRNKKNVNIVSNTNHSASRWMIPAAIGGMLLARLVSNLLEPGIQDLINNAVFAWIIITFSYAAFVAWWYLPKEL